MKKIITLILIISSFYLTDKALIFIDNKKPIMQEIIKEEDNYNTLPVNAEIKDNTIIPGINGKKVNRKKSLIKMEEFKAFNDIYLKYDIIKPEISLENNKDKIIIKGNTQKNSISLLVEENAIIENYLNTQKIKYTLLSKITTNLSTNREYINAEKDEDTFKDLNAILNKKKLNKKICLINYSNIETCLNKKYYIINYNLKLKEPIITTINTLTSGDIILIPKETDLENIKLIINEAYQLDLNIDYVSNLISENI